MKFAKIFLFILAVSLIRNITTWNWKFWEKSKHKQTPENQETRFNKLIDPITNKLDLEMSENFRDFAGLGYTYDKSAYSQINEIKKGNRKDTRKISSLFKILFEMQKWEHVVTKTYGIHLDYYTFTIVKNKRFKKAVFCMSGTQNPIQLMKEGIHSGPMTYKNEKPYIKIMKYFMRTYRAIEKDLKHYLNQIKQDKEIDQFIFTGHSLGGAMASITVFDFMQENLIPKTVNSPALFTYGQPRTGNYAFANELMKMVPIVFRHVNKYDPVVSIPACYTKNGHCVTEFGKGELDKNFNDYENIYRRLTQKNKGRFYAFHIGGLVMTDQDMKLMDCTNKSEVSPRDKCKEIASALIQFHTYYYGYEVDHITRPGEFTYGNKVNSNLLKGNMVSIGLGKNRRNVFKEFNGKILNRLAIKLVNPLKKLGLVH